MIYVFDLDGTLGDTTGRSYVASVPFPERIAQVNALFDAGHTIIIDSARGSLTGDDWHLVTTKQLLRWGVKFHELRTGKKVYADHYIDDCGHGLEWFDDPTH